MLRDATSSYRATLDSASGRIANAAALSLTTPGVGTGVTGLPISSHQLGFVAPNNGIFDVYKAGDKTTPNAGFTVTTNVNYTFESGMLGGFSVGATGLWRHEVRKGYATVGGTRQLYLLPDSSRYDLRAGYRLKLRKTSWNFQFTVQNLRDNQPVEATLAANGGISVINISQVPGTYLLSMQTRL